MAAPIVPENMGVHDQNQNCIFAQYQTGKHNTAKPIAVEASISKTRSISICRKTYLLDLAMRILLGWNARQSAPRPTLFAFKGRRTVRINHMARMAAHFHQTVDTILGCGVG